MCIQLFIHWIMLKSITFLNFPRLLNIRVLELAFYAILFSPGCPRCTKLRSRKAGPEIRRASPIRSDSNVSRFQLCHSAVIYLVPGGRSYNGSIEVCYRQRIWRRTVSVNQSGSRPRSHCCKDDRSGEARWFMGSIAKLSFGRQLDAGFGENLWRIDYWEYKPNVSTMVDQLSLSESKFYLDEVGQTKLFSFCNSASVPISLGRLKPNLLVYYL